MLDVPQDLKKLLISSEESKQTFKCKHENVRLAFVNRIIQKTVDGAAVKGFDKETYDFSLDSSQSYFESFLFGIVDKDIDFKSCPTNLSRRHEMK